MQGRPGERVYAEKLIVMAGGQEAPFHYHRAKTEDIVARGDGALALDLVTVDRDGQPIEAPVAVTVDGLTDNYFLEPFAPTAIEEDEPAYHPLWSDLRDLGS